jgi:hypothetical protein
MRHKKAVINLLRVLAIEAEQYRMRIGSGREIGGK